MTGPGEGPPVPEVEHGTGGGRPALLDHPGPGLPEGADDPRLPGAGRSPKLERAGCEAIGVHKKALDTKQTQ